MALDSIRMLATVLRSLWGGLYSIPKQWDSLSDAPQGTIEEVFYQTHAYATDKRDVMKSALVYLPAGYDENKQYNILYLLHGSGDD